MCLLCFNRKYRNKKQYEKLQVVTPPSTDVSSDEYSSDFPEEFLNYQDDNDDVKI